MFPANMCPAADVSGVQHRNSRLAKMADDEIVLTPIIDAFLGWHLVAGNMATQAAVLCTLTPSTGSLAEIKPVPLLCNSTPPGPAEKTAPTVAAPSGGDASSFRVNFVVVSLVL